MRRVLIFAYYFPPMGLSGVQRITKLIKYLPSFGWNATVITVKPGGYFAFDETLMEEIETSGARVIRTSSFDPTRLYGKKQTVNMPQEGKRRMFSNLSQFLLVTDNKIGWLPFAVGAGKDACRKKKHDLLFATAPPYTGMMAAKRLQDITGLPLVLDLRDDWMDNPRHVYPTAIHRKVSQYFEKKTFSNARHIFCINENIRQNVLKRTSGSQAGSFVSVIPQGFDPADFKTSAAVDDKRLTLLYTGIFNDVQTPDYLLRALSNQLDSFPDQRKDWNVIFAGLMPDQSRSLISQLGLDDVVRYKGYVAHQEVTALQQKAHVLWMTIGTRRGAESISTGKLFEYFGASKPVLGLVPEGTAREHLLEYKASYLASPANIAEVQHQLSRIYADWA